MRGLIILEGADGTGKTTLAKHLQDNHGARYLHMTYRYKDKMFLYHAAMLKHAISMADSQLVVLDRCWWSDTIYGAEYRGGSKWPLMGRFLDRVALKHAAYTVMALTDDMEAYAEKFQKLRTERVEMYDDTTGVAMRYNDLYYGYDTRTKPDQAPDDYAKQLIRRGGLRKRTDVMPYRIDDEGRNVAGFADVLLNFLDIHRCQQAPLALGSRFQNFLGHAHEAKYVLIGDEPSDSQYRDVRWPFFAYRNSSLYLTEAMGRLNLDETQFCWVNINDDYGYRSACHLIDTCGLIPIVMGEKARAAYIRLSLPEPYRYMPHPQYLRRFTKKSAPIDQHLMNVLEKGDFHV